MAREIVEVLDSAARTASPTSVEVEVPPHAEYLELIIDVTAVALTPSITLEINGIVPVSGTEFDILDTAAITATGVTSLILGPNATGAANEVAQRPLPHQLVVDVTHADTDSITYSVVAVFS